MVKRGAFLNRLGTILLLCGAIALTCAVVQVAVRAMGAAIDLTANHGPGQVLLYGIIVAAICLFARQGRKQVPLPTLALYAREWPRVLRGFLLTALPTCATTLIAYALLFRDGILTWAPNDWRRLNAAIAARTLGALLIVVLLAATEELIFRGFLFNYLNGGEVGAGEPESAPTPWGVGAAVVGSATLFALVHHFRDPQAWLDPRNAGLLIGLFLLGVLLAITYRLTRSLACSVGVHSGLLWPEVFRNQTRLFDLHQCAWWTGTHKDIRTAPATWALFALLLVGIVSCRAGLRRMAAVEPKREAAPTGSIGAVLPTPARIGHRT